MENQQKLAIMEKMINELLEKAHTVRDQTDSINSTLNGEYPACAPCAPDAAKKSEPNGFFEIMGRKLTEVNKLLTFSIRTSETIFGKDAKERRESCE